MISSLSRTYTAMRESEVDALREELRRSRAREAEASARLRAALAEVEALRFLTGSLRAALACVASLDVRACRN